MTKVCNFCRGIGHVYDADIRNNKIESVQLCKCPKCEGSRYIEMNEQIDRVQNMSLQELAQFLYHVNHSLDKALNVQDMIDWLTSKVEREDSDDN